MFDVLYPHCDPQEALNSMIDEMTTKPMVVTQEQVTLLKTRITAKEEHAVLQQATAHNTSSSPRKKL